MRGRKSPPMPSPCAQCPWRTANHGQRHPHGFYRKANLRRLWNQIRGGGGLQSCHMTDTGHPDHVAAGAKGDRPHECAGSLVLVQRELRRYEALAAATDDLGEATRRYLDERRQAGLKKRGLLYWLVARRMDPPFGEGFMATVPPDQLDDPAFGHGFPPARRAADARGT